MQRTDNNPLVSVIVLNLNGLSLLRDCLDSLVSQTHNYIEVIVVDNGSVDVSVKFIKTNYPKTIIIENNENLGFAKGNNQGIERAKGKYIVTFKELPSLLKKRQHIFSTKKISYKEFSSLIKDHSLGIQELVLKD